MAALLASGPRGAGAADEPPNDAATREAREAFVHATGLAKRSQWGEALAEFERSASIRPHAVTWFNIGACERALGRYTRARRTLARALGDEASLPAESATEARAWMGEIDRLLARVRVSIEPGGTAIAVDGRPLAAESSDARSHTGGRDGGAEAPESANAATEPALVAGLLAPGPGETAPAGTFVLLLDPGVHVLALSRHGFATAVVNRTFSPGSVTTLKLALDRLPATLRVSSNEAGAVVAVDGRDVGVVPVEVLRPPGTYRVEVHKSGFVSYETKAALRAGEHADLHAPLRKRTPPLTERWWFWTAASVVVTGAAVATYAATRSDPQPVRPEVNGGGLGWKVVLR